jgi:hypothetical protein
MPAGQALTNRVKSGRSGKPMGRDRLTRSDVDAHPITEEWAAWVNSVLDDQSNAWSKTKLATACNTSNASMGRVVNRKQGTSQLVPMITAVLAADGHHPPDEIRHEIAARELQTIDRMYAGALMDLLDAIKLVDPGEKLHAIAAMHGSLKMLQSLGKHRK